MTDTPPLETPQLDTPAYDRAALDARRRSRNRALGLLLTFFAVLFFAITIVRIGQNAG